ncbi:MAG TPA: hypothetical protein VJ063_05290 [Verrucomicrobiae bacterium]|nr:hypothetical protein [Verrucomicrobiae bacterium]
MLLDLNAPRCADMEFVHWTQRRVLRPVLAAFSSLKRPEDSKLAEELQADLYEADISDANVFNRFLHFAGNIADLKRRGSI